MATDFGRDTSRGQDGLRTGRLSSGARLVGESLFCRYTTPRGTLRGGEAEQNFGLDLIDLIGSVSTSSDAVALQGKLAAEGRKDERILSIAVDVAQETSTDGTTSFAIAIAAETTEGPFELQIAATKVSVERLGITVKG